MDLRYPIGSYTFKADYTAQDIEAWIDTIDAFPAKLQAVVDTITDEQLATPYRPDGWTIRQVINHVADSHVNAYGRFKRTATEDTPTVNPYDQAQWAELDDGKNGDVQVSADLITSVHNRWVRFMRSQPKSLFDRTYNHPEHPGTQKLVYMLGMYAWHCEHHLAHIYLVVKGT